MRPEAFNEGEAFVRLSKNEIEAIGDALLEISSGQPNELADGFTDLIEKMDELDGQKEEKPQFSFDDNELPFGSKLGTLKQVIGAERAEAVLSTLQRPPRQERVRMSDVLGTAAMQQARDEAKEDREKGERIYKASPRSAHREVPLKSGGTRVDEILSEEGMQQIKDQLTPPKRVPLHRRRFNKE